MNIYWQLGILAAVALGSWHISDRYHAAGWQQEKAGMIARADTLYKGEAKRGAVAADKAEGQHAKDRIVYRDIVREVDRIVTRDVYRNVCLDADGVRVANDALTRTRPDTAKPVTSVSGPVAP